MNAQTTFNRNAWIQDSVSSMVSRHKTGQSLAQRARDIMDALHTKEINTKEVVSIYNEALGNLRKSLPVKDATSQWNSYGNALRTAAKDLGFSLTPTRDKEKYLSLQMLRMVVIEEEETDSDEETSDNGRDTTSGNNVDKSMDSIRALIAASGLSHGQVIAHLLKPLDAATANETLNPLGWHLESETDSDSDSDTGTELQVVNG